MAYTTDWKPTKATDPDYKCGCGSNDVWFRKWEPSDGGHEDIKYECRACQKTWWAEGADY